MVRASFPGFDEAQKIRLLAVSVLDVDLGTTRRFCHRRNIRLRTMEEAYLLQLRAKRGFLLFFFLVDGGQEYLGG